MNSKQKIKTAIIGGGPAGIFTAVFASQNPDNDILIIDKQDLLKTLLPTGGGRCNLAFGEFDFRELVKYYPRGEKFLLSIFSKFSTSDTLAFFEEIGIKTYMQEDFRIFPVSNSSSDVRNKLLEKIKKQNIKVIKEEVVDTDIKNEKFIIKTKNFDIFADNLVIATGGRGLGQTLAKKLGHNIISQKPALCALKTEEQEFYDLSGITIKNLCAKVYFENKKVTQQEGDLLFTHFGISGPLSYKISSYCAYQDFCKKNPLNIKINLTNFENFEDVLIESIKTNPKKDILNVLDMYIPRGLAEKILLKNKINPKTKSGQLKKEDRMAIVKNITEFSLNVTAVKNGEEIVTAGGVDLKEINPKTMESKIIKNLYFCGEVIDVDGLTGGFNLQNCWSTGYVCAASLK